MSCFIFLREEVEASSLVRSGEAAGSCRVEAKTQIAFFPRYRPDQRWICEHKVGGDHGDVQLQSALRKQRPLGVKGQPGLYSKFKASQGYIVRSCL